VKGGGFVIEEGGGRGGWGDGKGGRVLGGDG